MTVTIFDSILYSRRGLPPQAVKGALKNARGQSTYYIRRAGRNNGGRSFFGLPPNTDFDFFRDPDA